jgi:hypothetical protein
MADEANDGAGHPYCLYDTPAAFGASQAFLDGTLKWDNKWRTAPEGKDETIRQLCLQILKAHADGKPLRERQELITKTFMAQYTAPALKFYHAWFGGVTDPRGTVKTTIHGLLGDNIPFIPWDRFHGIMRNVAEYYNEYDEPVPPVNRAILYRHFILANPFAINLEKAKKKSAAVMKALPPQDNAKADEWAHQMKLAIANLRRDEPASDPSDDDFERKLDADRDAPQVNDAAERYARHKALAKLELAKKVKDATKSIDDATAHYQRIVKFGTSEEELPAKRQRRAPSTWDDDEDASPAPTGALAIDKFMKTMRLNIERSHYIDFASMSKERLDQLQVLGVGSSTSKRLNSSTVMVTSASEADIKTLTHDHEAISSGFLYSYIKLLSESSFDDAMDRVKDRLAWWQWLTDFFGQNRPAKVKFIHAFMLKHHAAPFWMPVTEERCSMLAIQARDNCPPSMSPPFHDSGNSRQKEKKNPRDKRQSSARVFPGPGTLTIPGGVTFSASQTAKLVQWRARFPGYCQSRMTKEYTCSREKRGMACKFKHDCAWCHSPTCKAACAQAEKL